MIIKFIFLFLLAGSAVCFVIVAIRFLLKKVNFPAHHLPGNGKTDQNEGETGNAAEEERTT